MICKKKILIAPLNWGLGHASRCIPIIKALLEANFEPIIASDGEALTLLQKEFPSLKTYTLPSYNISYTKRGFFLKFKLLQKIPSVYKAVKKEREKVAQIIKKEAISGIISDNRFGVFSDKIPSVYITHQLKVLSGLTTIITSVLHQYIIKKFDECWVPDVNKNPTLSGKLSHLRLSNIRIKYIGGLSRFKPCKTLKKHKYSLMILLSGPEPQRTLLETKLVTELKNYDKKTLIVRGVVNRKNALDIQAENVDVVDYLLSEELAQKIHQSELVISRSGYSTIMDMAALNKKVFFIPTPGQLEQEYLAKKFDLEKIAPYCKQHLFTLKELDKIKYYKGFVYKKEVFNKKLFNFFKSK